MIFSGQIHKMISEYGEPIQYFLNFKEEIVSVNQAINKHVKIEFLNYECVNCRKDKEIYSMGMCKNCFFTCAKTADWILKPELSKAHLDIEERDLEYEKKMQLQPHVVYIAYSSGYKVGVTRKSQIPTRWIDQGAKSAIRLAETNNRHEAGIIEVALKDHISDKTNYRKMLIENPPLEEIHLADIKEKMIESFPENMKDFIVKNNATLTMYYPVVEYPKKITSVTLKKKPIIEGKLIGIKGQYLIFDTHEVFNVRNHEGYVINLSII